MKTVFESSFKKPDHRWVTRELDGGNAADNCAVTQGGKLKLLIKEDSNPKGYNTGMVWVPSFQFTFGLIEARVRHFSPKGAHSSFWLQPEENAYAHDVKATPNNERETEIDIFEHFGDKAIHHNIYWRDEGAAHDEYQNKHAKTTVYDPYDWHTYGCRWKADSYTFFIDGVQTAKFKKGLSTTPKVLILSILVSSWEEPKLKDDLSKYKTEIDWVRVKQ